MVIVTLIAVDKVVDVSAMDRTTLLWMSVIPVLGTVLSLVVKHFVDKRNAKILTEAQTNKLLSESAKAASILRESQLVQHNDFLQAQLLQVKNLYDMQLKQAKEMYESEKIFREEMKQQLELKIDVQEARITGLIEELKRLKTENEILRAADGLRGDHK